MPFLFPALGKIELNVPSYLRIDDVRHGEVPHLTDTVKDNHSTFSHQVDGGRV